MKKDHKSLTVSLQLTQIVLEQVMGESKEKDALTDSLRGAAKARKSGGEEQRRQAGEMTKRRQYETCVQRGFYDLARLVYDPVLDYATLQISELFPELEKRSQ